MQKIEQFLLYLLFVTLPFQTRVVLYSKQWYFSEWQSITLYATDLILLGMLILWLIGIVRSGDKPSCGRLEWALTGFIVVAGLSIMVADEKTVGFYQFARLVLFALFFWYVRTRGFRLVTLKGISWSLVVGGVIQSGVAIGQYVRQGDLGLRILGETILSPTMQGVASFFTLTGEKVMRAYGTTPHPNVLAAYLLLSVAAVYWLSLRPVRRTLLLVLYPVLLVGLLLTFSRTVIFSWVLLAAGTLFAVWSYWRALWNEHRRAVIVLLGTTVLVVGTFAVVLRPEVESRLRISGGEEAVDMRLYYARQALLGPGNLNWLGIGLGNFTGWLMEHQPNLPRQRYQPVHNIYLLIYAETGILGIIGFLVFLFSVLYTAIWDRRRALFPLFLTLFLFIAFFDHFLWTLQQGRIMFWMLLALTVTGATMKEDGRQATRAIR